jgi:hypothetical protein
MLTDERLLEVAYMKLILTVIEEPSFLNNLGKKNLDAYRDALGRNQYIPQTVRFNNLKIFNMKNHNDFIIKLFATESKEERYKLLKD